MLMCIMNFLKSAENSFPNTFETTFPEKSLRTKGLQNILWEMLLWGMRLLMESDITYIGLIFRLKRIHTSSSGLIPSMIFEFLFKCAKWSLMRPIYLACFKKSIRVCATQKVSCSSY